MKTIKIKCQGAATLPLEQLHPFQGDLKSLSTENFEKLKLEILDHGFSFPISVWKHDGNSVPPNFMRAIAEHIRDNILTV